MRRTAGPEIESLFAEISAELGLTMPRWVAFDDEGNRYYFPTFFELQNWLTYGPASQTAA